MHTWKHYNPVEIKANICANEELICCISECDFTQSMILLVTSTGMLRRKVAENVMQNIACPWHIFEAKPEPDLDVLDAEISRLRKLEKIHNKQFSVVIALGGGSAIDSAKALACGIAATNLEKPLHTWLREKSCPVTVFTASNIWANPSGNMHANAAANTTTVKGDTTASTSNAAANGIAIGLTNATPFREALPIIAIPTNAGTGAEVTPFATIWDNKNKKKCSLVSRACFPKIALLDPTLTLSLPWKETLYGALDAFSHALETLWNKTATPISLNCAHTALTLIMENLPLLEKTLVCRAEPVAKQAPKSIAEPLLDAVTDSVTEQYLQDISARSKLQEAACIAGIAISQSHSSIGHSISYPLTLHHKIQHGLSCSAFLLPIMDFVEKHNAWMLPLDTEFKTSLHFFLQKYAPHKLVREFCNEEQAQSLVHEMFTPERAGTFVCDLKTDDVQNILKNGFTL